MSYHNDEDGEADDDTGMLLNLSQKSSIFVADQTPTPTRLIKNCEEVGLFEDLRNVSINPFDITFRRACEQQTPTRSHQNLQTDEECSLHTPQVFPQFDAAVEGGISAGEDLTKQTLNTPGVLDVATEQNEIVVEVATKPIDPKSADGPSLTKYRAIAEKPPTLVAQNAIGGITFLPSTVQFIQPQLITVTFPSSTLNTATNIVANKQKTLPKTKPVLLPKLDTNSNNSSNDSLTTATSSSSVTSTTPQQPEPSSASLTPTSQLPIKERLKAILNQSSKSKPVEWPDKNKCYGKFTNASKTSTFHHKSSKDDTMERRRAASTRYRKKVRDEHKDLRKQNSELQSENSKLKQRIKQLEAEVAKLQSAALQPVIATSNMAGIGMPAQIQIPASTIHLVMNIPKIVVPCDGNKY